MKVYSKADGSGIMWRIVSCAFIILAISTAYSMAASDRSEKSVGTRRRAKTGWKGAVACSDWWEITSQGLETQAILRIGNGYEEIVNVAKEMKVDLIVIGSHSYWGLGRKLLGSTLERVLQYAPCPVLVVQKPPVGRLAGRTEPYED